MWAYGRVAKQDKKQDKTKNNSRKNKKNKWKSLKIYKNRILKKTKKNIYAHIEVLVTFLLVIFFGFLVITRSHEDVYGRNLVEIDPTSLPQLSKQLRDLKNSQKPEKNEIQNFKNIENN